MFINKNTNNSNNVTSDVESDNVTATKATLTTLFSTNSFLTNLTTENLTVTNSLSNVDNITRSDISNCNILLGDISTCNIDNLTVDNINGLTLDVSSCTISTLIGDTDIKKATLNSFKESLQAATIPTTVPYYPVLIDMSTNNTFYIPLDYIASISVNFEVNISNFPITENIITVSLLYYQTTYKVYCNKLKITDVSGNYIFGSVSASLSPLFNSGIGNILITTNPCLIIQQFSIIPMKNLTNVVTRYVISNVSNNY